MTEKNVGQKQWHFTRFTVITFVLHIDTESAAI